MTQLDKHDKQILRSLQASGRATFEQIGEAVSLSPSAVLRRVKRLEVSGVIDTLLKHPSVQDCKTSFVLDTVKSTTAVPI